jgi:hypothetical protein
MERCEEVWYQICSFCPHINHLYTYQINMNARIPRIPDNADGRIVLALSLLPEAEPKRDKDREPE